MELRLGSWVKKGKWWARVSPPFLDLPPGRYLLGVAAPADSEALTVKAVAAGLFPTSTAPPGQLPECYQLLEQGRVPTCPVPTVSPPAPQGPRWLVAPQEQQELAQGENLQEEEEDEDE